MNAKQLEGLVLLRDGLSMATDGIQKLIEAEEPKELNYDMAKIPWVKAEGPSGVYEKYPATDGKIEANKDYTALIKDLAEHNNKLTRDGYFIWLFRDGSTIGRKLKRK